MRGAGRVTVLHGMVLGLVLGLRHRIKTTRMEWMATTNA